MHLNRIVVPQLESYILFAVCKHSPAAFLKNAKKIRRDLALGPSRTSRQAVPRNRSPVSRPKDFVRLCQRRRITTSVRQIQHLSVESHAIVLKGDIQNYLRFQLQFLSGEEAAQVPSHSSVADTGFYTHCYAWTPCLNPDILQSSSHHLQPMVRELLPCTLAAIYPSAE